MSQRTKSQLFCKTHSNQPGAYFLADQPWNKFCSECALNMALCGKKIDKDLSAQQFDNRAQVFGVVERIKDTISRIGSSKKTINQIVMIIQKVAKSQLAKTIQAFDQYVRHLCQTRDEIIQIFQTSFPQLNQSYFEKQTKLLLSQIELQKNLEYIQMNYRSIIQNKLETPVNQKIQEWNDVIATIDKILPKQNQYKQIQQFICQQIHQIKSKLSLVQPFKFSVDGWNLVKKSAAKGVETLTTFHSVLEEPKQNQRKTQLKLRSKSRQSQKKSEIQTHSIKTKKSIRDVSNFYMFQSFNI